MSFFCSHPLTLSDVIWDRCAFPCSWCTYIRWWYRLNKWEDERPFKQGPYR